MRIVYLNPTGALGGAERLLLDVLAAVPEIHAEAELHLIVATDGPLIRQAEKLGARVTLLPMPDEMQQLGDSALKGHGRLPRLLSLTSRTMTASLAIRRYTQRLRQTIEDLRPALVHSNGIKFHLLTGLTGLNNVPVVWHLHDFLGSRPLMSRALRWASRRLSGAIAVSKSVAEDTRKVLRHVRVDVVYNAVDTGCFFPAPVDGGWLDELAGQPAAEPDTLRVGLVATFARWKGQDVFLEAAARLLREQPGRQVRFYIIGGPIYRTAGSQFSEGELQAQTARLALGDRVGFIPFQQEPADVYRALDVVVHASTQPEPFGLTIVEAMACGKAVVVSRAGGAAELFTHDHDALGVTPGDVSDLASAISRLLDDLDRRSWIGANARRTAVARFGRQRLGQEVTAIYDRYLAGRVCRVPTRPVQV